MVSKTSKEQTACDGRSLGIVVHGQAINIRVDNPSLRDLQATFVARRTRLRPELARVVAELLFDSRRAA